jgi:hypothetical protein
MDKRVVEGIGKDPVGDVEDAIFDPGDGDKEG